jgi:putative tryptophan/tyrosine transport system substrate-binding protein
MQFGQFKRREFITLIGSAAAWPLAARAQQPAKPVIGFLGTETSALFTRRLQAFRQGLAETGYVESQNVVIADRWAEGQNDRLRPLAAELVHLQVRAIVTAGGNAARAAKAATTTIPVVFWIEGDPVQVGLVASLNRPDGNVTGVTTLGAEMGPKRLEMLRELVPKAAAIAVLVDPTTLTAETLLRHLQAAAHTLGLKLHVLRASTERDFDTVFATLVQQRVGGLVIGPGPFFMSRSEQIASRAVRYALPVVFDGREFVTAGGLMSYGGSLTDAYRLVGVYAGRVLKGEKPADLPVQQATKVEMVINLKTAKALGLEVPSTLLARADEVIE